ncbi:glucosyltransferase domain-containing protein [Paenibacillus sp. FSL R10-2771]|uniref:glucosyltransferase domain-containing protein n=1 Tax=Paenibacillus sp. FSL R10-2771 TaxID=2954693 RepID=UPI0030FB04A0
MLKKDFRNVKLWSYLILGILVIYLSVSLVVFGRVTFESPALNTNFEITTKQLYSSLKDFNRNGDVITSNTEDPWINLEFEKALYIKKINIEVSGLSVDRTSAQIYYASVDNNYTADKYIDTTLKNGSNIVDFKDNLKIKSLRLDLTNSKGISVVIPKIQVDLSKNTLLFWTVFTLVVVLYCLAVCKSYFIDEDNKSKHHKDGGRGLDNLNLWKELIYFNDTNHIKLLGFSFLITSMCYFPYISNLLYSIDDYYLNQIYDINLNTLGYNFYSTGRFSEAILAQFFYFLNIQPLTKPLGPLLFIGAMCLIGLYFTKLLKIRSFNVSLGFILIFTTNPFLSEIFSYSIVTAYSAFAVLALCMGVVFGEIYVRERKVHFLLLSLVGYLCSLTVYQIFFPIVSIILIYRLIVPTDLLEDVTIKKREHYKRAIPFLIYILSFVLYTVILKVCFYFWPPTLKYSGGDISEFLNNIKTKEYWDLLYSNIRMYTFQDNPFNSKIINSLIWLFSLGTLITYYLRKGVSNLVSGRKLRNVLLSFMLIVTLGLCLSFGFSILRPVEISSRSLTAFGLYQSLLVLFSYYLLTALDVKSSRKKIMITIIAIIVLFGNMGRIGRSSMDQHRLNNLEHSLVTRIVSRMETNNDFSPNSKLVIVGSPETGGLSRTNFGDYNTPAIRQFAKVFLFNEISGYNFQTPNDKDIEKANSILENMEPWPSASSIKYVDNLFIVKLN